MKRIFYFDSADHVHDHHQHYHHHHHHHHIFVLYFARNRNANVNLIIHLTIESPRQRKLYNKEFLDFYSSPDAIRVVKSTEWDWRYMWHALQGSEIYTCSRLGKLKESHCFEEVGTFLRIILKWMLKKKVMRASLA